MATSKGTLKGISKGRKHAIASNSVKVQNGRSEPTKKVHKKVLQQVGCVPLRPIIRLAKIERLTIMRVVGCVLTRGLQPQCQSECTDKTLIPGKIPSSVPTG